MHRRGTISLQLEQNEKLHTSPSGLEMYWKQPTIWKKLWVDYESIGSNYPVATICTPENIAQLTHEQMENDKEMHKRIVYILTP